ncbi:DUF4190 domain-containing protein [uncultured Corynebacterium sp.]|jgi:hypothetical protein|uniref:DUF4190 domain-containing protein n=1 Tax=uncultured Corynebacterium sp. TaxID=159447 RepID=UPI0028D36AC6|nr:DUF4190 domain-containing protein [uncultured Corynebacterium sp.]
MSIPNYSSYSDPNLPGAFPDNDMMMSMGKKNVMAMVALVLALIGLVTCWVPVVGVVLSFIGFILAIIALAKVKNYLPLTARKGMSIAALIISVIGVLIGGLFTAIAVYVMSVAPDCLTIADPTAQSQCIQEKITNTK